LELLEALRHEETGETHASLDGTVGSTVGFALDETGEEAEVVAVRLGGLAGELGVLLTNEGSWR
jgi:hypothetical protein